MLKTSEARRRANAKYDAGHTKGIYLKLNITTDAAILDWLEEMARRNSLKGKQGYIKSLIIADMKKHGISVPVLEEEEPL